MERLHEAAKPWYLDWLMIAAALMMTTTDDDEDGKAKVGGQAARSKVEQWTVAKAHLLKEPRNSCMFLVNLTISISFCQRNHLRMLMIYPVLPWMGLVRFRHQDVLENTPCINTLSRRTGTSVLGGGVEQWSLERFIFFDETWTSSGFWCSSLGRSAHWSEVLDWSSDSWFLCKAHNDLQEGGLRRFNIIVSWWCKCWCHNLPLLIYNFSVRDGADRLWIYFLVFVCIHWRSKGHLLSYDGNSGSATSAGSQVDKDDPEVADKIVRRVICVYVSIYM